MRAEETGMDTDPDAPIPMNPAPMKPMTTQIRTVLIHGRIVTDASDSTQEPVGNAMTVASTDTRQRVMLVAARTRLDTLRTLDESLPMNRIPRTLAESLLNRIACPRPIRSTR